MNVNRVYVPKHFWLDLTRVFFEWIISVSNKATVMFAPVTISTSLETSKGLKSGNHPIITIEIIWLLVKFLSGRCKTFSPLSSTPVGTVNRDAGKKVEVSAQLEGRESQEAGAIFSLVSSNETVQRLSRKPHHWGSLPAAKLHCHFNNKSGIPSSQYHLLIPSFPCTRKFPLYQNLVIYFWIDVI